MIIFVVILSVIATASLMQFINEKDSDKKLQLESVVRIESGSAEFPLKGTGFVTLNDNNDKIIVTNAHIIIDAFDEPFTDINIQFFNDTTWYNAAIVKFDLHLDLAVLTVNETSEVNPLNIANSDKLGYGDRVLTIGNSAGLSLAVSSGVISVPSVIVRYQGNERTMIQTDIDLNHGGSGGPLLNEKGEIIGCMTLRYVGTDGSVRGISYAIPSNIIKEYVKTTVADH